MQSCGTSPGFIVKEVQCKVPCYRLDMRISGQEPPFNLDALLAIEPLTLSYYVFHEHIKTQQYAAEWRADQWRNFEVSKESHSKLLQGTDALDAMSHYSACRLGSEVFLNSQDGRIAFSGKHFQSRYPTAYWMLCNRDDRREGIFVRVFSHEGVSASKNFSFYPAVRGSLEVFVYSTGERIVLIDTFGNDLRIGLEMAPQFHFHGSQLQAPFLLWQPNVSEAFAIDLRSVLPRKKR